MASYNKFNSFVEKMAEKTFNLQSDSLKIALTDTLPVAGNTQLSDITEISYTNLSSRALTVSSSSQTGGTYKLVLADLVLTASGAVAQYRYIVIYDDTATNKELIAWFDYGVEINMVVNDTVTLDFDGTNGVLQLA